MGVGVGVWLVERLRFHCMKFHAGREYLPGGGTNHMNGGGVYLEQEPIKCVERVSTWSRNQSQEKRGCLPGAGTNHMLGEGVYLEQEPITCWERVSTWSRNQSHEGRGYLPPGPAACIYKLDIYV